MKPYSNIKQLAQCHIIALCSVFIIFSTATAEDINDHLDLLLNQANEAGFQLSYDAYNSSGARAGSLTNVAVTSKDRKHKVTIAKLSFIGAARDGKKNISFEKLHAMHINYETKFDQLPFTLAIADAKFQNLQINDVLLSPPVKIGMLHLNDISAAFARRYQHTLKTAAATVKGFGWHSNREFNANSIKISQITGKGKTRGEEKVSYSIGACSIAEFSKSGRLGLQIGSLNLGETTISGPTPQGLFDGKIGSISAVNLLNSDYLDDQYFNKAQAGSKFVLNPSKIILNTQTAFSISKIIVESDFDEEANTYGGFGQISEMHLNPHAFSDAIDDGRFRQNLAQLGLKTLTLDYVFDGKWNPDSGGLGIDRNQFGIKDLGAIDLQMHLEDFTADRANQILKLSDEINQNRNNISGELAKQLLSVYSPIGIKNIAIVYDDASLVDRLLKMQSKRTGVPPQTIAAGIPLAASVVLAGLGATEFTKMATDALTEFLADPNRITISAEPDNSITIAELITILTQVQRQAISYTDIIDQLNITIEAEKTYGTGIE